MQESGVLEKTVLAFGQMNEPPAVRLRIGMTGLTMAEYFRDVENQDVPAVYYDNIYAIPLRAWKYPPCGTDAFGGRQPADSRHEVVELE
jgi:hypothetical protein